jgi:hypothetical protein
MNPDILKSYLVKVGMQIDTPTFDKVKGVFKEFQGVLEKTIGVQNLLFVTGVGIAVKGLLQLDEAIIKTIDKVAKADMSYQLLARQMYITADAAKAFKQASDTLGVSLQDLAWNAELKERYVRLVRDINEVKLPSDAKQMWKEVREAGFQFNRLKLLGTQAIERIAYELVRLNRGELSEFSKWITNFNDNIRKNLPEWSRQVAEFLSPALKLTKSLFDLIGSLWELVKPTLTFIVDKLVQLNNALPSTQKELIMILGLITGAIAGGAIVSGLSVVLGLLIAIDDAMAFQKGHESMKILKPLWTLLTSTAHGINMILIAGITLWDRFWAAARGEKSFSFADVMKEIADNLGDYSIQAMKSWEARMKAEQAAIEYNRKLDLFNQGKGPKPDPIPIYIPGSTFYPNPTDGTGNFADIMRKEFGDKADRMWRIAGAESSFGKAPSLVNANKNGSVDVGLFQINETNFDRLVRAKIVHGTREQIIQQLLNPVINAQAANYLGTMSEKAGKSFFAPWSASEIQRGGGGSLQRTDVLPSSVAVPGYTDPSQPATPAVAPRVMTEEQKILHKKMLEEKAAREKAKTRSRFENLINRDIPTFGIMEDPEWGWLGSRIGFYSDEEIAAARSGKPMSRKWTAENQKEWKENWEKNLRGKASTQKPVGERFRESLGEFWGSASTMVAEGGVVINNFFPNVGAGQVRPIQDAVSKGVVDGKAKSSKVNATAAQRHKP